MASIQFKAKIENMGEVGSDVVLYQYVCVPVLTRKHCDMAAFRNHPKYGAYANSDLFNGVLARIRQNVFNGQWLKLNAIPAGVTVDTTKFLAVVSIDVGAE
jgi:hypothetical protein